MKTITTLTAAAICAIALTACGGGGDDNGNGNSNNGGNSTGGGSNTSTGGGSNASGNNNGTSGSQMIAHTVTPSISGTGGAINPASPVLVPYGLTATFNLTPNGGDLLVSIDGTCGGTLSGNIYTTEPITSNCSVIALFAHRMNKVTMSDNIGGGSITNPASGIANVPYGVAISASFVGNRDELTVSGTCGGSLNLDHYYPMYHQYNYTYHTKPIISDCTVVATWK